ncbi:MBOAT family protein, partial [Campylobacter coli]|nr:MBOAT family protein [Campylobacter coli]
MTYFSLEFSILMIVFFAIYWAFKDNYKIQNILILAFSYLIYILINPYFALILFIYTFFIHFFALLIFVRRKRYIFATCITFIILNLCFFKYFPNIKGSLDQVLSFLGLDFLNIELILPIGISFYTFASITYLVDV